jgi:hypothetical protein
MNSFADSEFIILKEGKGVKGSFREDRHPPIRISFWKLPVLGIEEDPQPLNLFVEEQKIWRSISQDSLRDLSFQPRAWSRERDLYQPLKIGRVIKPRAQSAISSGQERL